MGIKLVGISILLVTGILLMGMEVPATWMSKAALIEQCKNGTLAIPLKNIKSAIIINGDKNGKTAIDHANSNGHFKIRDHLFTYLSQEHKDDFLRKCANGGDHAMVSLSLNNGSNPLCKTERGMTPLILSAMIGSTAIVMQIVDHEFFKGLEAVKRQALKNNALFIASQRQHFELVSYLLKIGAQPGATNSDVDLSSLEIAKNFKIIKKLLPQD